MKKIYFILIVGILLVGGITAASLSLDKKDFTKDINKISSEEACEKFYDEDRDKDKLKFKKCKDKDYELDITNSMIEIKQDPSTGLLMVSAK